MLKENVFSVIARLNKLRAMHLSNCYRFEKQNFAKIQVINQNRSTNIICILHYHFIEEIKNKPSIIKKHAHIWHSLLCFNVFCKGNTLPQNIQCYTMHMMTY